MDRLFIAHSIRVADRGGGEGKAHPTKAGQQNSTAAGRQEQKQGEMEKSGEYWGGRVVVIAGK